MRDVAVSCSHEGLKVESASRTSVNSICQCSLHDNNGNSAVLVTPAWHGCSNGGHRSCPFNMDSSASSDPHHGQLSGQICVCGIEQDDSLRIVAMLHIHWPKAYVGTHRAKWRQTIGWSYASSYDAKRTPTAITGQLL